MMKIAKPSIGISECLLGNSVRYNGKDKQNDFLKNTLSHEVNFISFCPEDLCFGTPREAIDILNGKIKTKSGKDVTNELQSSCESLIKKIKSKDIVALIFKSKSPSCGKECDSYTNEYELVDTVNGIFYALCKKNFKQEMFIEDIDFEDKKQKFDFLLECFTRAHIKNSLKTLETNEDLEQFVNENEIFIRSKDQEIYKKMSFILRDTTSPFEAQFALIKNLLDELFENKKPINAFMILSLVERIIQPHLTRKNKTFLFAYMKNLKNDITNFFPIRDFFYEKAIASNDSFIANQSILQFDLKGMF